MPLAGETCAPWATDADLCSPCDLYELDAVDIDDALQMATDVLFNFTGRRWPGVCEETVRPCRTERCGCQETCGCGWLSEVHLPGYPVVEVTEVLVDGDVVPESEYRVDDARYLVGLTKADGTLRRWPSCQRLERADSEDRTFSVTYSWGLDPPVGGIRSAASLACQLLMACQPEAIKDGRCRLPKRVTTITRQGITLAILDPLSLFREGLTGLAEVDLWVASVRAGDSRRGATVVDPLRHRSVRRPG
jgi:hypothetical protein